MKRRTFVRSTAAVLTAAALPFHESWSSTADIAAVTGYVKVQSEHDHRSPHGRGYYMSGISADRMEPDLIDLALHSMQ